MKDEQNSLITRTKAFEQRIINTSVTDLLFYDQLADKVLQCCPANIGPNVLSALSVLPVFLLALVVSSEWYWFLLTIVAFLMHQVFDIANKKQAYRLSSFSLATYHLDHLADSLSCCSIVVVVCCLMDFSPEACLTCVFFFGMLPFYTHHLAMYNGDFLVFSVISPNTEGLAFLEVTFLIATFYPSLFVVQITQSVAVYHIITAIAAIWLLVFLGIDLKLIMKGKRVTDFKTGTEQPRPFKNLFIIVMLGYIVMEITSIEPQILKDGSYFILCFLALSFIFVHIIGNLVLAYGWQQRYKQVSGLFLISSGAIVLYYMLCAFILDGDEELQFLISKIVMGVVLALVLLMLAFETRNNLSTIYKALDS